MKTTEEWRISPTGCPQADRCYHLVLVGSDSTFVGSFAPTTSGCSGHILVDSGQGHLQVPED
jgi:hypothetical protein